MTAIDKLAKLAAGFRGTFTVGDDVGIAYDPSPDDADGDGPRVTFQQAVVDLLNAIGPALAEVAALARHKTAAGPAESVHAALGVSSREAAIAAMANGVPCPTCGAESAAVPPVSPRTLYECRTCSTTTGGGTDGSFDDPRWSRIAGIDGPDAICPTCIADPVALDDLREEYPRASIAASPPTDAPEPCAHMDRALDGSCFGCGSDENNPTPEATP